MKEKRKAIYVSPEFLVLQVSTRSCMLAGSFTESMSEAAASHGMETGSFGARSGRFSRWEDFDEEE